MKSITLLLIPLILLSSCTIDRNDKQIATQPTLEDTIQTGATIVELPRGETSTGKTMKDFGSGFILSQTEEQTELTYSGKVIKTWPHTPPQENPFIWDDACTIVWKGFEKLAPENQSTGKQGVWDALTEKEKKDCMKEVLQKYISVSDTDIGGYFYITQSFYKGANRWIYNKKTQKISEPIGYYRIKKIYLHDDTILFHLESQYDISDILHLYDGNFHLLREFHPDIKETIHFLEIQLKGKEIKVIGSVPDDKTGTYQNRTFTFIIP